MDSTIDQLIKDIGELPPLPQVAQKALALIRTPETNVRELADIIAVDQTLSSLLLRWANSATVGARVQVTTVGRAVTLLGMDSVRELILASSVASFLNRPLPGYELHQGELWRRSVGVAIGAETITKRRGFDFTEEAYFAGLLCDIGKLAMEKLLRNTDTMAEDWLEEPFLEKERSLFGIDHAQLGAEMARQWNLPEVFHYVIAHHHTPSETEKYQLITSVVHLADSAVTMMGIGLGKDGLRYTIDQNAVKLVGINGQDLDALFGTIMEQIHFAEIVIGFE
jgi:putative nucleotidyltransferase with HDIG domain